jgi:response regulator of citrate/malate metabolism
VYSLFWFFNVASFKKQNGGNMNILLIEDYKPLRFTFSGMLRHFLGEETNVFVAENKKQAREIFAEHHAWLDLILMDLFLKGEVTFDLIQEIRFVYQGPMVAIPSDTDTHARMLECGCTHACDKRELPRYIEQRKFEIVHT